MIIQTMKIEALNPAPYNPRKKLREGDRQYAKLKKSIEEFGLVEPIVWNRTTGNVIGGHQRLKVLEDAGIEEVEVSVVDLSPAKEKMLNVALNKIEGEWNYPMLTDLLIELDTGDVDMGLTGFDETEILQLVHRNDVPTTPEENWRGMPEWGAPESTYRSIMVHFKTKEDFEGFQRLIGQEITQKAKYIYHPAYERRQLRDQQWAEGGEPSEA